ncbi:hypothetical protein JCM5353_005721 [Sporobolomyces roseus]
MSRTATPQGSRPATPSNLLAAQSHSRPHSRSATPSRLQRLMNHSSKPSDYNAETSSWIKSPPNNLGLVDPSTQFRGNDLLSNPNTEATTWGDPVSKEEARRISEMAKKLAK